MHYDIDSIVHVLFHNKYMWNRAWTQVMQQSHKTPPVYFTHTFLRSSDLFFQ
jgi:hypothetical protein